jgi:AraC-like DNA-binding protein
MKKKLILLIFLLFLIPLYGKQKLNADKTKKLSLLLNSLKKNKNIQGEKLIQIGKKIIIISESENNKKTKIIGLQTIAKGYISLGKNKEALEIFFKTYNLSQKFNYPILEANACSELGNLFYFCFNDFQKAIEYYKKSLEIYSKIHNQYGEIKIHNNLAEVLMKTGRYRTALNEYIIALEGLEKMGDTYLNNKIIVLGNLIDVSCILGNLKTAKEYINNYEIILKRLKIPERFLKLYTYKAKYYTRIGDYNNSLFWINKAHNLHNKIAKNSSPLAKARVSMSILTSKLEIQLKMNNLNEVKKGLINIEHILGKFPAPYAKARFLLVYSEYYYKVGKINKAVIKGEENVSLCEKYNFLKELSKVYSDLSIFYLELNKKDLSLKYYRKNSLLNKRISMSNLPADVMGIIMKYEKRKLFNRLKKVKRKSKHTEILMSLLFLLIILLFIFRIKTIKLKNIERLKQLEKNSMDKLKTLQDKLNEYSTQSNQKSEKNFPQNTENIMQEILKVIELKRLYLNMDLDLEQLEKEMKINRNYLSNAINICWGDNFNSLINSYRIKEAKKLLTEPKNSDLTILQICFKVGFNSKSTFNRVFKDKVKITPRQYREIFSNQK